MDWWKDSTGYRLSVILANGRLKIHTQDGDACLWSGEKSCNLGLIRIFSQIFWLAFTAVWTDSVFHLYRYAPAVQGYGNLLSKSKKKCAALWSMSLVSTLIRLPMPANLKIKMATSFSSSKKKGNSSLRPGIRQRLACSQSPRGAGFYALGIGNLEQEKHSDSGL